MDDKVTFFKENGYVEFSGLYSGVEIDEWRALIDILKRGNGPWIIGSLLEKKPRLALQAILNSRILDFAEQVMGPFVQLDGLTLVGAAPSSSTDMKKTLHWHRDPWGNVPTGHYYRPWAINALCYLQDLDDSVGPLRVLPGSHKNPMTLTPAQAIVPLVGERLLFLRAGDVVVLHNNLIHSRTPNFSSSDRFYFSLLYNHGWLRQTTKVDSPIAKSVIQMGFKNSDHRLLRLFGVDLKVEQRGNSGFLSQDEDMWREWIKDEKLEMKNRDRASPDYVNQILGNENN